MKKIPLTRGKFAFVDDEDFERLSALSWGAYPSISARRTTWYARSSITVSKGKCKTFTMHSMLIECPKGLEIDHVDGNGLNNKKSNLRLVTHAQNMQRQRKSFGFSSRFKGVSWDKFHSKWCFSIHLNKKLKAHGYFHREEDAADAYNKSALEIFGAFARLNIICHPPPEQPAQRELL